MFKHYLTTALRHFREHKIITSINVVCLTIGLVCFLAIYAMITYISSGDKHFANSDRIYFLQQGIKSTVSSTFSSAVAARYLKADFPKLETVARATINVGIGTEVPITTGEAKGFFHIAYADPEFLEVFALPFLTGDSRNALRSPRSAVISKDLAQRLFGSVPDANAKSLRLQDGTVLTVRGVVDELKKPSHITTTGDESTPNVRFDVLISMDVLEADFISHHQTMSWGSPPLVFTYMVLPKDGSLTLDALRNGLKSFGARHANTDGKEFAFEPVLVSDYWLSGVGSVSGTDKNGPKMMFYFLGLVVLLISCLNYANLATAQAATRAKEIGMRRAMGARRVQIIVQFMMEAALLSIAALGFALVIIAIGLVALPTPDVAAVVANVLTTARFWLLLLALIVLVTVAAGLYPAFVLSAVRPLDALRVGKSRSGGRFMPRLLVGLQFAGASFLLISMLVIGSQNRFVKQSVLGNASDALVALSNNVPAAGVDYEVLRRDWLQQPDIKDVTASLATPWTMITMTSAVSQKTDVDARTMRTAQNHVHYDFFSTLDIKLLAGRLFDREHAGDSIFKPSGEPNDQANIVIDKILAEQNGWLRPDDALGKVLYVMDNKTHTQPRTVVGVVEHKPMSVLTTGGSTSNMYLLDPAASVYPIIRISNRDVAVALKEIESAWNKLAPSVALKIRFADDLMNRNYQSFGSMETVFNVVATLATLISILGLIGMSLQVIGRRQHEIGVRKTLGASVHNIVRLLLIDFSKPVVAANFIAWPLAFVAMSGYLSLFAQRTTLSVVPFALALLLTVLIAWIAVGAQSTRAARLSPATVLRSE
jgi:putative ABC transport system permease protein